MQIAIVNIDQTQLPRGGGHDLRMAMTHGRHIVIGIKIGRAVGIVQPAALGRGRIPTAGRRTAPTRQPNRRCLPLDALSQRRIQLGRSFGIEGVERQDRYARIAGGHGAQE